MLILQSILSLTKRKKKVRILHKKGQRVWILLLVILPRDYGRLKTQCNFKNRSQKKLTDSYKKSVYFLIDWELTEAVLSKCYIIS